MKKIVLNTTIDRIVESALEVGEAIDSEGAIEFLESFIQVLSTESDVDALIERLDAELEEYKGLLLEEQEHEAMLRRQWYADSGVF